MSPAFNPLALFRAMVYSHAQLGELADLIQWRDIERCPFTTDDPRYEAWATHDTDRLRAITLARRAQQKRESPE